ncbi:MAG: TadE/TadG family type IV pilus assembly protein [Aureliella sp.]
MTSTWRQNLRRPAGLQRHRGRTRRARPRLARAGAAVVEFAFVAPLLIMLTFGMIELGRLVMVKQLLINASREGARLAVLPASTEQDVLALVNSELASATINGATVVLTPASLANAPAGSPVTVSISISSSAVSWIPKPMFVFNQTLEASTTMRRESL